MKFVWVVFFSILLMVIFGMPNFYANAMPPPLYLQEDVDAFEKCQTHDFIPGGSEGNIEVRITTLPDDLCYIMINYKDELDLNKVFCKIQVGQFKYHVIFDIDYLLTTNQKLPNGCYNLASGNIGYYEIILSPRAQVEIGVESFDVICREDLQLIFNQPASGR